MKYRFLNFLLDVPNQELLDGNRSLSLSARNFRLLQVLVENPGRVFAREELIERVWPNRFVTQNSLDQALSKVRRVIAEATETPCIETVYGKGIRFLPVVTLIDPDEFPESGPRRESLRTRPFWIVLAAAIALSLALLL